MERATRIPRDTLHDPKQMLVRVPRVIRKNQLAAGILPLALDNCCDKVLGNWDARICQCLGCQFRCGLSTRFRNSHDF